jgi:hypothetical protein
LIFTQVSVGDFEACAITPLGYAYCWTFGGTPTPVSTAPLSLSFASISVGHDHKCAIANYTAKAYCWGVNDDGQLGVNSYRSKSQPTEVLSPVGNEQFQALAWYSVDAGNVFSCGIQQPGFLFLSGGANCWGKGDPGQVGNGLTLGSAHPEAVFDPPGTSLDLVSAGGTHACGIELASNNHGDAWCWGDNSNSQLGDPAAPSAVSVPNRVSSNRVYKQISAGENHTCALSQYKRADNVAGAKPGSPVILCWGLNDHGQLGNTLRTNSSTPVTAIHPQQVVIVLP